MRPSNLQLMLFSHGVRMPDFFERLNYSFGNEDWRTEQQALNIQPQDTVLCITASGDRPLHLLLNDCKELISIDANPIQNYLLSLKRAAMQAFDFPNYLNFLEGRLENQASDSLHKLLPFMDGDAAHYWMHQASMLDKGILFQGHIERIFKHVSMLFRCLRPKKVKRLFEFENLEEQRKFLHAEWDTLFLRKLFVFALNPIFPRVFFNDPGLFAHVDSTIQVGAYIYDRMLQCLQGCLASENAFVSLMFQGALKKDFYPPYLTAKGTEVIKPRLDKIKIKTENVINYLKRVPDRTFDAFSLSDIASYMSKESFDELMQAVYRTAKPGARFCIRQFSSNHQIPIHLKPYFQRDINLEKKLEAEDYFFVYRFLTGEIFVPEHEMFQSKNKMTRGDLQAMAS
ncbi:hypothetical protein pah_c022o010 [Parachlamydia acanthamoebae str. Hall's coccus]|nr:hypothetical protein pah_c022o010 [Parachlamydia acanthamoebae str. Hall's coccus]